MRWGHVSRPAAPYQGGHPFFSGKLKLGWIASYPKSWGYTHSRMPEGKRTPRPRPFRFAHLRGAACYSLPQRPRREGAKDCQGCWCSPRVWDWCLLFVLRAYHILL